MAWGAGAAALGQPCHRLRPPTLRLQAAFARYPQLLGFVVAEPPSPIAALFQRYAERLSAHISDLPPPLPTSVLHVPVGGWSWTSTGEALRLLRELAAAQVSLALLEGSGIAAAVAQLRTHSCRELAAAAEGIVQRWRSCAVAALACATAARDGGAP